MTQVVHTVRGTVNVKALGHTLIHEHLVFGPENHPSYNPEFDRDTLIRETADELRRAKAEEGLGTLVDLTPTACSRDVSLMKEISERSGVNIIACTGFWEGSSYPDWVHDASIDELASYMEKELREEITGTTTVAGIIKVATGQDAIQAHEARVFRAAARAQRATGAAIITHTGLGTMGWEQLAILEQEGADLNKVIIGHLDSRTEPEYHRYILKRGANVAFDRLGRGRPFQPEDSEKADVICQLISEGFASKIFLSHDNSRWFTMSGGIRPDRPPYTHVLTTFVPLLKERGVTDEDITTILVRNPSAILPLSI